MIKKIEILGNHLLLYTEKAFYKIHIKDIYTIKLDDGIKNLGDFHFCKMPALRIAGPSGFIAEFLFESEPMAEEAFRMIKNKLEVYLNRAIEEIK